MMKTLQRSIQMGLLCLITLLLSTSLIAQTSLKGNVTDEDNGEPILFGNVSLYKNGLLVTGVETDFDGNYNISNIDAGTYDVEVRYVGYQKHRITGVPVLINKVNRLNIEIKGSSNLEYLGLVSVCVPLMQQEDISTKEGIVTADQIKTLPTKNINGLIAIRAGVGSHNDDSELTVRSGRSDSADYYIEGIRVRREPKVIIKPPTFTLNTLTQIASPNAISLNFEIIEKGNITIQLFNSRKNLIYNRTTFMDLGKQMLELDFMNTANTGDFYQLIVTHENGFQKNESITIR